MLQVPVITTTQFVQGSTWRWGLAWSFDESLKDKVCSTVLRRTSMSSQLWLLQVAKAKPHKKAFYLHLKGKDGCSPYPSLAGVRRVKDWLMDEWKQLEVSRISKRRNVLQ
jgi:hypothetical protein